MKQNLNIDQPHLKENPYTVPEGYFSAMQAEVSDKVSARVQKPGFWVLAKPQIALVSTFAIIFLIAFATIKIFSPGDESLRNETFATGSEYIDGHYIESNFVDFYDTTSDSTVGEEQIDPEEIVEYLSSSTGLIYLASLE
ncbi:MAG: hypothetical protein CVT93_01840 [Bacteroidetes bacterium HGW-Bacteroidetes-10]|jgi:hypothetical protein|nr:MAG: hypothetical protein CVT93_01840 [Bacteroidetes bacterium HGW-Bacteroidetes-10]